MITIESLEVNDNMTLTGIVEASQVTYEQKRTVEGVSKVSIHVKVSGRLLTLGSDTSSGSIMGIWCKSLIEEIKEMEKSGTPKTLNYHGDVYYAYIVDTSDFTPLFKWEPEGPTKKYTGTIKLIEA